MPKRLRITVSGVELEAELFESSTAESILRSLPCESSAIRWGDEIYFDFPVDATLQDEKQVMEVGDIGYWVEGKAMAIFFGPTPVSEDEKPKAAVPVTFVGRVLDDATRLREVESGDPVRLEAI